uniref:Uncharacterized protein n=1 Tax=Oryza brachyantha TaxID=4533 RepID=J3M3P2_ORYBR
MIQRLAFTKPHKKKREKKRREEEELAHPPIDAMPWHSGVRESRGKSGCFQSQSQPH